jgi:competence protein ComEC
MLYRESVTLNSIAAAAVFILLVRPLDLWSVGFQLSFAATFAIVIFARQCEKWFHLKKILKERNRLFDWILGTVIVSVAAQLGTLALTMYYFGYASTYFLLTNMLVLPIAFFLVPCGLVSIVLGGTVCGVWFSKVTWVLAWLMNHSVGWIESLPGSTLPCTIGIGMVLIYYALLLPLGVLVYEN